MTTTIYVTSTQSYAGKTALCTGLLCRFRRDGFAIGYMKPISTTARAVQDLIVDEDILFIKSTFCLPDSQETMAPLLLTEQKTEKIIREEEKDFEQPVLEAFHAISRDKDIVLLEGLTACSRGGSSIWRLLAYPIY